MNEKVVGTNQNEFTEQNCAKLLNNHIDHAPLMIRCRIYENDSSGIENKKYHKRKCYISSPNKMHWTTKTMLN